MIYIFSQPVRTGKTTLLMQWLHTHANAAGILVPVVDGKRMLYDISNKIFQPFEAQPGEENVEIGKFRFSKLAFEKAQTILLEASHQKYEWLIVDEIGKLELHDQSGLEPAVSNVIAWFRKVSPYTKLVLVIRDYLLHEAIAQYGLQEANIISPSFFDPGLSGLVLCGGRSVRMGMDKAQITYHEKPQVMEVYGMMSAFTEKVFVSCNNSQVTTIPDQYAKIIDSTDFSDAGPMTGLLSAFSLHPHQSFLVVGCDYPFFTKHEMMNLVEARDEHHQAVCYENPVTGIEEPLLAVYESSCARLLFDYYKNGNTSLRQFLKTIKTKKLVPTDIRSIKSIDTKEEWEMMNGDHG